MIKKTIEIVEGVLERDWVSRHLGNGEMIVSNTTVEEILEEYLGKKIRITIEVLKEKEY